MSGTTVDSIRPVNAGAKRRLITVALLGSLVSACAYTLPPNANSLDIKGEKVVLTLLDGDDWNRLCGPLGGDTVLGKGSCPAAVPVGAQPLGASLPGIAPIVAPLVGAAIGLGVDLIKSELQGESKLYTAQYGARVADDKFWKISDGAYSQNYIGLQLVRETAAHSCGKQAPGTLAGFFASSKQVAPRPPVPADLCEGEPALRMVWRFQPSHDGEVLLARPVYFKATSSHAKILDLRWYSLPSWFMWFFKPSGHEEHVAVDFSLDSIHVDGNQQAHIDKLAAFGVSLGAYDLDNPKTLGDSELRTFQAGWFQGVPISTGPTDVKKAQYRGTFWIGLQVTETDPSNAQQYLKQAADYVGNKQEQIIQQVEKVVGGGGGN